MQQLGLKYLSYYLHETFYKASDGTSVKKTFIL